LPALSGLHFFLVPSFFSLPSFAGLHFQAAMILFSSDHAFPLFWYQFPPTPDPASPGHVFFFPHFASCSYASFRHPGRPRAAGPKPSPSFGAPLSTVIHPRFRSFPVGIVRSFPSLTRLTHPCSGPPPLARSLPRCMLF